MIALSAVRDLVDDVFEEQALAIGGLLAVHDVDNAFVRGLFATLVAVRGHAVRQLDGAGSLKRTGASGADASNPHPAVEEFLARLGRD